MFLVPQPVSSFIEKFNLSSYVGKCGYSVQKEVTAFITNNNPWKMVGSVALGLFFIGKMMWNRRSSSVISRRPSITKLSFMPEDSSFFNKAKTDADNTDGMNTVPELTFRNSSVSGPSALTTRISLSVRKTLREPLPKDTVSGSTSVVAKQFWHLSSTPLTRWKSTTKGSTEFTEGLFLDESIPSGLSPQDGLYWVLQQIMFRENPRLRSSGTSLSRRQAVRKQPLEELLLRVKEKGKVIVPWIAGTDAGKISIEYAARGLKVSLENSNDHANKLTVFLTSGNKVVHGKKAPERLNCTHIALLQAKLALRSSMQFENEVQRVGSVAGSDVQETLLEDQVFMSQAQNGLDNIDKTPVDFLSWESYPTKAFEQLILTDNARKSRSVSGAIRNVRKTVCRIFTYFKEHPSAGYKKFDRKFLAFREGNHIQIKYIGSLVGTGGYSNINKVIDVATGSFQAFKQIKPHKKPSHNEVARQGIINERAILLKIWEGSEERIVGIMRPPSMLVENNEPNEEIFGTLSDLYIENMMSLEKPRKEILRVNFSTSLLADFSTRSIESHKVRVDRFMEVGQMIEGVAFFHGQNGIHRDIKPENFLHAIEPSGLSVSVMSDFAQATIFTGLKEDIPKIYTKEYTLVKDRIALDTLVDGSWNEEDRVKAFTLAQKMDVFALGCTIYLAFNFEDPFMSFPEDEQENDPNTLGPQGMIPDELWGLIKSMLSPDPDSRPTATKALRSYYKFLKQEYPEMYTEYTEKLALYRKGS